MFVPRNDDHIVYSVRTKGVGGALVQVDSSRRWPGRCIQADTEIPCTSVYMSVLFFVVVYVVGRYLVAVFSTSLTPYYHWSGMSCVKKNLHPAILTVNGAAWHNLTICLS